MSNNTLSRAELTDSGEVQNIHYGDILTKFGDVIDCSKEEIPFVADKSKLGSKISYLQNGDVIIADTAEDDAVGKATEILNLQVPVVSGLHTMACRPQFEFEPRYLGYYINSACYHNQLYPFMQGVKVTSVSKGNIALTEIRYPANDEQHKIASMIALVDARIEKQRTLIESLKLYKRGVIKQIFSEITTFVPLRDIVTYQASSHTQTSLLKEKNGQYPVYDASGIFTHISTFDIDCDYVAIIKDGSGVGRLQYCIKESSLIGTLGAIIPNKCTARYLIAALETIDFAPFVTGAAIPHVYFKDYGIVNVPFPNTETQNNISRIHYLLTKSIEDNENLLKGLIDLKNAFLQQMFI